MKELTIEEKAQRYDEALEYAKSALDWLGEDYICNHLTKDDIRGIYARLFQELRESEVECEVEPKFHKGEWVVNRFGDAWHIDSFDSENYQVSNKYNHCYFPIEKQNEMHLWTIQDAKDGDVLATSNHILIFEKLLPKNGGVSYCHYDFGCSKPQFDFNKDENWYFGKEAKVYPATRRQRGLLFQKMKEAGYEWDVNKKELKKINQKNTPIEGEFPYGNPSDTLEGEIENIWGKLSSEGRFSATKDGFREVITHFVNYIKEQDDWELVEQKSAWSEEDEKQLNDIIELLPDLSNRHNWLKSLKDRIQPKQEWSEADESYYNSALWHIKNSCGKEGIVYNWLKSLKDRIQPKQEWKQGNTSDLTDFENAMMHIGNSFFGQYAGLDPNDTNAIKEQANILLELIPSKGWSEEDEYMIWAIPLIIKSYPKNEMFYGYSKGKLISWIKSIKDRVQPKQEWSEEDNRMREAIIDNIKAICKEGYFVGNIGSDELINWLKFLKERIQAQSQPAEWSDYDECMLANLIDDPHCSIDSEYVPWLKSLKGRVQPQNLTVTDEELSQAKKDAYNEAFDKIEYHSGEPTFDDGWSAAIWYLKKKNTLPQSRWKPSDEQIRILKLAVEYWRPDDVHTNTLLWDIIDNLKNL